jgi:hypothetical protein
LWWNEQNGDATTLAYLTGRRAPVVRRRVVKWSPGQFPQRHIYTVEGRGIARATSVASRSDLERKRAVMALSIVKCFMFGLLIFSAFAWADERADRAAIQSIVDALNDYMPDGGQRQVSALFTEDANQSPAFRVWTEGSFPRTHRGRK